jgi:tetratricopeptide (TPR) repeat protein
MKKLTLLLATVVLFSCTEKKPELKAPLFTNLGNYEMKITTGNEWCQKFFNQGIALTYGFNHAEAHRSFMEAARLDSNCAMAYWGAALVNGPNINAPMFDTVYPSTYRLVQKALSKMDGETEKEKALITALSKRYPSSEPAADRSAYDQAYADAMRNVYRQFPDDDDVAVMTGEALMDLHPWNLWLRDGRPQPWTPEIVDIFEKVLARNPDHPGANHYYIHAVEASPDPGKALEVSARLPGLVPGAGHLVHMPAHIYIRTGDYHKASAANEEAIRADSSYFAQCHAQGFYPATYANHNVHFLFITAAFEGRSKDAIGAAQLLTSKVPHEQLHDPAWGPTLEQFAWMDLLAYIRFGKWDEIIKSPEPDSTLGFSMAMWHYARGYALVADNDLPAAEKEHALLSHFAADTFYKTQLIFGINNQYDILNVAAHALAGEIESKKGNVESSSLHFTEAIRIEESLNYNEPPDWFFPVRHAYGAMLLDHGKYAEAEQVYRDDLRYNLKNPWATFGLYQSLEKQGRTDEAAAAKDEFEKQWQHADFELSSPRIL